MGGAGLFAVDLHTGGKLHHLRVADVRADGDAVGFGDVVAGVHDEVGEIAVVGEQQHALAVLVQPANRVDALRHILHQLGDTLSAQLVAHGGHIAARLVQHDVIFLIALLKVDPFAVDGDDVAVWIDLLSQHRRAAVDLNFALGDPLLDLSAGSDSLLGEHLLYSDSVFH